nr:MAG TPA: hypothetical protein [Caudoviricetes sp.]
MSVFCVLRGRLQVRRRYTQRYGAYRSAGIPDSVMGTPMHRLYPNTGTT